MKPRLHMVGLLLALCLSVTACGRDHNKEASSQAAAQSDSILASAPTKQKKFCAEIGKYIPSLKDSTNFALNETSPIQHQKLAAKMSADRAARKAYIVSLLGKGEVEGWVGKVHKVFDPTSNDVAIMLNVGCDTMFEAVGLESALTAQTVIPKSSRLYNIVHARKVGDRVTFSGHLIRRPSLPDGYQELSVSDLPSLEEPRFNFKITRLSASR